MYCINLGFIEKEPYFPVYSFNDIVKLYENSITCHLVFHKDIRYHDLKIPIFLELHFALVQPSYIKYDCKSMIDKALRSKFEDIKFWTFEINDRLIHLFMHFFHHLNDFYMIKQKRVILIFSFYMMLHYLLRNIEAK